MKPDLQVVDRDGNPVLVAEVKDTLSAEQATAVAEQHAEYKAKYELVATRDKVFVYDGAGSTHPALTLNTEEIIRRYAVAGGSGPILTYYLQSSVATWLLDLGQRLYSDMLPGAEELQQVGILAALQDTFVVRDYEL